MLRISLGSNLVVWAGLTLAAAGLLSPEPAAACSGNPCFGPRVEPSGGEVPEDFLKLTFWPARDARREMDGPPKPQLYLIDPDSGSRSAVAIDIEDVGGGRFSVQPQQPVAAGSRLVFEAETVDCTDDPALSSEFLVTEQRALPKLLGTLDVHVKRAALQVATVSGSCDVIIDAVYAEIEVKLSDDAKPFADILGYALELDGKSQLSFSESLIGAGSLRRGHDRVYAQCPDSEYSGPLTDAASVLGKHRIRVVGSLPDGTLAPSKEAEFELKCTGPRVEIDAGNQELGPVKPGGMTPGSADEGGCAVVPGRSTHSSVIGLYIAFGFAAAAWRMRGRRKRAR